MSRVDDDSIIAVATPYGTGGIGVIRLSGPDAVPIVGKCWKGGDLEKFSSHTAHLGWIRDRAGEDIDQVVLTLFRAPNSYTGENVVEISCHGSVWILQAVVNRLVECGARVATGGEFTQRAFLNGRLDLAQAEGVGDMIAASSKAAARLAVSQMRGDFSKKLELLRQRLLHLGSLLELELDFSEEDVEFADRAQLISLAKEVLDTVSRLASSYKAGNAFKHGVPVVIAGVPNAGKSTLLNALLGEQKAIVSDIPGTTRDVIEDTVEISGILFRFFDTAGLRQSDDTVESIGIERARQKISEAEIVIRLFDPMQSAAEQAMQMDISRLSESAQIINIATKKDIIGENDKSPEEPDNVVLDGLGTPYLSISAKTGDGIDELKHQLVDIATSDFNPSQELIVTNARHYESLTRASTSLETLLAGLESGLSADFLAQDLREATHHLGAITGAITTADLLQNIFENYCIGK